MTDGGFTLHYANVSGDRVRERFETEAEGHQALGRLAGLNGWDVHVHAGDWSDSAASVAYERGGDPVLDARAVLRATSEEA